MDSGFAPPNPTFPPFPLVSFSDTPPHFQVIVLDKEDKPIIWDIEKVRACLLPAPGDAPSPPSPDLTAPAFPFAVQGRNNLFLAFVAMLWYIKTERHGRIDTEADQSLSRAGLNVLQILPE